MFNRYKNSLLIGLVLLAVLSFVNRSHAEGASEEKSATNITAINVNSISRQNIVDKAELLRKPVDQDALIALKDVQAALEFLMREENNKAFERLQHAELLLKNIPGINSGTNTASSTGTLISADTETDTEVRADKTLTISSIVKVAELNKSNDEIQKELADINRLLGEHQTQLAKIRIAELRDEAIVNTITLPVATFLTTIKIAAEQIKNGKDDLAFNSLKHAIDSLITTEITSPLSLIAARDAIARAMSVGSGENNNLISYARSELEKAELLGYVRESDADYLLIKAQIDELKYGTKDTNGVLRFYQNVMDRIDKFWNEKSVEA